MSAAVLVALLRDPSGTAPPDAPGWAGVIAAARAERLLGTLATRLEGLAVPADVAPILADARVDAERERRQALWEVDRAMAALAPLGIPVVMLKGSAFVAAGLSAGTGRAIGDLDILVPRESLPAVEAALLGAGWEWVKQDAYDDDYYRRWMHELPPLIHVDRDRMIDVHHTILPLTAKPRPLPIAMIAQAISPGDAGAGALILSPEDMVIHAAAHLFADGDLAGGLRNLWDIDRLCREFAGRDTTFYPRLHERAAEHGLLPAIDRALRLTREIYGTPVHASAARWSDALFRARLLSRDHWGMERNKALGFAFYLRSHLLRMPPRMLARHLWTKWRKGYRPVG